MRRGTAILPAALRGAGSGLATASAVARTRFATPAGTTGHVRPGTGTGTIAGATVLRRRPVRTLAGGVLARVTAALGAAASGTGAVATATAGASLTGTGLLGAGLVGWLVATGVRRAGAGLGRLGGLSGGAGGTVT